MNPNTYTVGEMSKNSHSILRQRVIGLSLAVGVVLLQGCSAIQEPFHQLDQCNVGNSNLTYMRIQYGKVVWPMTAEKFYRGGRDPDCLNGSSISQTMPIPDVTNIEWTTADGRHHKVDVPIKSKLNGHYSTHTIQVRINDDHVEVFERVYETPAKRVDFKIYP
jgi:hypothetical protein